jgi:hypothetical protein
MERKRGWQLNTPEAIEKRKQRIKLAHERGCYDYIEFTKGRPHTTETKEKLRKLALNSNHRRLKKNTIIYNGVLLDSTWELVLAKRLDYLGIKWNRPEPLKWKDESGITHNYFPDFYLEEYNLYLDPKNPHAFRVQKKKLDLLMKTYNNIVIIKTLQECQTYSPPTV